MPTYQYRAKKSPDNLIDGVVIAGTRDEAVRTILRMGCTPLEVSVMSGKNSCSIVKKYRAGIFYRKIRPGAIHLFFRQLCDLLEAGVPLLQALEVLIRQAQNPVMHKTLIEVVAMIKEGHSLSESMARQPEIFSVCTVSMVRSGEMSGRIVNVLDRLAQLTQKNLEVKAKIQSGLMYPGLVLGVGVLTMFVLLTVVLPRLSLMFADFDATLPWPTRCVMAVSDVCVRFGWLFLISGGAGAWFAVRLMKRPAVRERFDAMLLKLPLIGEFLSQAEIGRFARTLGILIDSGVTVVPALESAGAGLGNSVFRREVSGVIRLVKDGSGLGDALRAGGFLPEWTVSLIATGEESAQIQKGLLKLADMCERRTEALTGAFVTLVGPLVLIGIVAFVGCVIIAMLLPIFQMNAIIG